MIKTALKGVGLLAASLVFVACGGEVELDDELSAEEAAARPSSLPNATGVGALAPWGGGVTARWRPEAVVANAASLELNRAFTRRNVADAWVAVPLRMVQSGFRPFGDGQSNARVSFEGWSAPRPPVVATLVKLGSGAHELVVRFDRALPYNGTTFELRWGSQTRILNAARDASGDRTATLPLPASLALRGVPTDPTFLVHPVGWGDWFPLHFRMAVRSVDGLLATVPQGQRTMVGGASVLDPARISVRSEARPTETPFARLGRTTLPAGYNAMPYTPDNIHARFPEGNGLITTGVGNGWAWVNQPPHAPFKTIYQCFAARNTAAESAAGVPSGSGWHEIGDLGETILNSLESGGMLTGVATGAPVPSSSLPSGGFSYGLGDVAVFRVLRSGEALVTRQGNGGQPNFHWFAFASSRETCAELWVHPCRPAAGEATFQCE